MCGGRQKNFRSKVRASEETVPSALTHQLCYLRKGHRAAGCSRKSGSPAASPFSLSFQCPTYHVERPSTQGHPYTRRWRTCTRILLILFTFSVGLFTSERAGHYCEGRAVDSAQGRVSLARARLADLILSEGEMIRKHHLSDLICVLADDAMIGVLYGVDE